MCSVSKLTASDGCEVCSANLTNLINREAGSTSPVAMAAHENPVLSQEEEREHLTTFFTNRINELTAEKEKLRCDKDAKEDEYKAGRPNEISQSATRENTGAIQGYTLRSAQDREHPKLMK